MGDGWHLGERREDGRGWRNYWVTPPHNPDPLMLELDYRVWREIVHGERWYDHL